MRIASDRKAAPGQGALLPPPPAPRFCETASGGSVPQPCFPAPSRHSPARRFPHCLFLCCLFLYCLSLRCLFLYCPFPDPELSRTFRISSFSRPFLPSYAAFPARAVPRADSGRLRAGRGHPFYFYLMQKWPGGLPLFAAVSGAYCPRHNSSFLYPLFFPRRISSRARAASFVS